MKTERITQNERRRVRAPWHPPEGLIGQINDQPSRTQQHFKQETEIEGIIQKFVGTGNLVDPMVARTRQPIQGDFSSIPADFHALNNMLIEARESFQMVPAPIRAQFGNDPGKFVDFVRDPKNEQECIRLGLRQPTKVPEPPKPVLVRVVPDPAPTSPGEGKKG